MFLDVPFLACSLWPAQQADSYLHHVIWSPGSWICCAIYNDPFAKYTRKQEPSRDQYILTVLAHFDNSTRLSIPGKAVTGCAGQCFRNLQSYTTISWSQAIIAETITAATLVLIINNRTNSTRTSTIYNTEIDLGDYVPTTVNSAGTVTTSVVLLDGSTYSTRYM